jgi:hypothetical protein
VEGTQHDEGDVFRAVAGSGARALLIGRQALVALGSPVLTADVDFWIPIDDIEKLTTALEGIEHVPNRSPAEARRAGRYVLENSLKIDVMVARSKTAPDGTVLEFDGAWSRRRSVLLFGVTIYLPDIADLIVTKRWASRAPDTFELYDAPLPREEFEQRARSCATCCAIGSPASPAFATAASVHVSAPIAW